jgi:hypothetical protein
MVAEKSGWDRALPRGKGRGVALTHAFGSYAAQVVEVTVDPQGQIGTDGIVTVVDCGLVVSPRTGEAQVQGGTIFGLSAVPFGNISIKDGRVEQSNFHDHRVLQREAGDGDAHRCEHGRPHRDRRGGHRARHAGGVQRRLRRHGTAHPAAPDGRGRPEGSVNGRGTGQ